MKNYINLLYPEGKVKYNNEKMFFTEKTINDLDISSIIYKLSAIEGGNKIDLNKLITFDEEVIKYRNDFLSELCENDEFYNLLLSLKTKLDIYDEEMIERNTYAQDPTQYLCAMNQFVNFIDICDSLNEYFTKYNTSKSEALGLFISKILDYAGSESYKNLKENVRKLKLGFDFPKSITLAVNLNSSFLPAEVGVISINSEYYKSGNLIDSLLRGDLNEKNKLRTIAPFIPFDKNPRSNVNEGLNHSMQYILAQNYNKNIKQIGIMIKKYLQEVKEIFVNISELRIYMTWAKFIRDIKRCGFYMTKPKIAPKEERKFNITSIYNLALAMQNISVSVMEKNADFEMVYNNFNFNDEKIFIITGANSGGKTVLIQAIGIIQILFQLGLYVPASYAEISIVDNIFTYFTKDDTIKQATGRFESECAELRNIMSSITKYTLVLLNEPFNSTNINEAAYILKNIIKYYAKKGVRGAITTHIFSLTEFIDEYNEEAISKVGLLKTDVSEETDNYGVHKRTYIFNKGSRDSSQSAKDIATKYGFNEYF